MTIQTEADIAVLKHQLESLTQSVSEIRTENQDRDKRRSEDIRRILSEFDRIRAEMAKQQGFLNGAAFVIKAFWAAVGASAIGLLGWLINGGSATFK